MRWRALAVTVVLLTAGCSTFADSNPTPETVTPVSVPEVLTESKFGPEVAPGVGPRGEVNATRLAGAHRTAIANRSYVWTERLSYTAVTGNVSFAVRSTLSVAHERRYWYRSATTLQFWNYTEYADGEYRYQRKYEGGGIQYERHPVTNVSTVFGGLMTKSIERFLAVDAATVRNATVDGDPYYRVVSANPSESKLGPARDYAVVAHVAPNGFVRSLRVTYVKPSDRGPRRIRYHLRYSDVDNTTVDPPEWVSMAAR